MFLLQQRWRDSYADRIGNRNIYFSVRDKCFRLSAIIGKVVCEEISELNSNHEEAVRRYFFIQSMHLKTVRQAL